MKSAIIFSLLLCVIKPVAAQAGRTGLGMRASLDGGGITAKYFLDRGFAIEGQLNAGGIRLLNGHSAYAALMLEYHVQLPLPLVRLYFGGGVHSGLWSGRSDTRFPSETMFGLSGIGGVEFLFRHFPAGISGDLRPSINYLQEVEFFPHNLIGVSLRYYFGSNKVKPFEYPSRG